MSDEKSSEFNARAAIEALKGEYYKAPELKTWEPREFDLRYYDTPKKLAKETEKRNASYARDFERENGQYKRFCRDCETILTVGAVELRDFFVRTIEEMVQKARNQREFVKSKVDAYREKYDKEVAIKEDDDFKFNINPFHRAFDIFNYNFSVPAQRNRLLEATVELQKLDATDYHRRMLESFCPTEESKMEFARDYLAYKRNRNMLNGGLESPDSVFRTMVGKIAEIVDSIRKTLGGDPDGCSFDVDWGVGGHFNGIVRRGKERASFKSFFAGGYNIQRLHIRFRVTLLKPSN